MNVLNINPKDYLLCIFEQAADTDGWTEDDWKQLLPWNKKSRLLNPKVSGWCPRGPKIVTDTCKHHRKNFL